MQLVKQCKCKSGATGPRRVTQVFARYQIHQIAGVACNHCDTPWEDKNAKRNLKEKASFFTSTRF